MRATRTDGRGSRRVAGEGLAEGVVEAVDGFGVDAEGGGEGGEVGGVEVDAVGLVAALLLVVAEHPVAAVVDDHGGQGDLLLRHRGELAAGEQEAAVAGDRDDRAVGAGQRGAERRREGVAERAPAERDLQAARGGGRVEAGQPVARDAHVEHEDAVGGDGEVDRVEEAQRGGVERPARLGADVAQALGERVEAVARADTLGQRRRHLARLARDVDVGAIVDDRLQRDRDRACPAAAGRSSASGRRRGPSRSPARRRRRPTARPRRACGAAARRPRDARAGGSPPRRRW